MKNQNYCEEVGNVLPNPKYTSDVSNGYIQSKYENLFRCASEELMFSGEKKAVYVVSNPKNSGVNIVLEMSNIVNLSNTPAKANVYYCSQNNSINGKTYKSNNQIISNSNACGKTSSAEILYGINLSCGGVLGHIYVSPPYENVKGAPNGSTIIAPGYSHVIEIESIICSQTGKCVMTFSWWEEPIQCSC